MGNESSESRGGSKREFVADLSCRDVVHDGDDVLDTGETVGAFFFGWYGIAFMRGEHEVDCSGEDLHVYDSAHEEACG